MSGADEIRRRLASSRRRGGAVEGLKGDEPPRDPPSDGGSVEVELARMNGRIDTLHTAIEGSLRTLEAESRGLQGIVDARLQETKAWLDGMPAKAVIAMLTMLLGMVAVILGGIRAMDALWPPEVRIEAMSDPVPGPVPPTGGAVGRSELVTEALRTPSKEAASTERGLERAGQEPPDTLDADDENADLDRPHQRTP